MFHSFLYDHRKQDSATTTAHRKRIIELLKQRNIMYAKSITSWKKKYGCDDHYRIATALYLLSMLSQEFSIITNCVIRAPGHNREVFDGLNDAKKKVSLPMNVNCATYRRKRVL